MNVLMATKEGQGPADFYWCAEGEVVVFPAHKCDSPTCGCGLGFIGLDTRKGTTTAMVVEFPGPFEDISGSVGRSLQAAGFDPADAEDQARRMVDFAQGRRPGEIVRVHQEAEDR